MKTIFKCTECGKAFTLDDCEFEPHTINEGTKSKRIVCDSCFDDIWQKNSVVSCLNCGEWFDNDIPELATGERIGKQLFFACPNCGHDVGDGCSRGEYLEEAQQTEENPSFAATFVYEDGDNATYLFPTEEKRSDFIDQWLKDQKEDGGYIGSSRVHFGERVVTTKGADEKLHRARIIKSNVYR